MIRLLSAGLEAVARQDSDAARLLEGRFDRVAALLTSYIEEIERFNPLYSLVGAKDRRELVIRHILDSLAPAGCLVRLLDQNAGTAPGPAGPPRIADVGSGAGLPGIPLAIALPEARFTLIERMGRRAGFLRNALAVLALENAAVEEGMMEQAPPERFDLVVFRAFRPLEKPVVKGLLRLLRDGGRLAAYKGRRELIEAEMKAAGAPAGTWEAVPYPAPFLNEERHLVKITADI
ncbi:MAG: 16S rRNA (guanine(527)-N(7))-methyltransferase RsmG [Spirochaetaceae bacterium]|jgi:16S rRNA (guanine527-N7)-methyltransferase|nr:16S rRNA (guanine(527)-N(7))-methyltransferase RsmG [Spirochaetaceae bacterium]